MIKGSKMTNEQKKRLSIATTGKKLSKKTKEKLRQIMLKADYGFQKGNILSKGNKSFLGKHHTQKTKLKISLSKKGKKQPQEAIDRRVKSNTGKKRTLQQRQNIANGWSEERKEKRREQRLQQTFPQKDSKPEKMIQLALILEGIKFEKHKPITGQPDIFIEPNLCIFIDGDYWHANPNKFKADKIIIGNTKASDIWARDTIVNHELGKQMYRIIRLWESDIVKANDKCALKIIQSIKNSGVNF